MRDEVNFEGMSPSDQRRIALEYVLKGSQGTITGKDMVEEAEKVREYLIGPENVAHAEITNRLLKRIAESLEAKR